MVETLDGELRAAAGASPGERPARGGDPALIWCLMWALAALAAGCLLLVADGKASMMALLAMLIVGLPGLIGALWRPRAAEAPAYLTLWALAAAMAAIIEGGIGGPLAVWCVLPAVLTIVLDAAWAWGVGLSLLALLLTGMVNALHLAWRAPQHALLFWLTFVAVLTTAGGMVGALGVARMRAARAKAEVQAELDSFQALMGDLPELGVAMDLEGRTLAVFGQPQPGVDFHALQISLVEVAEAGDRDRVEAALREAASSGSARVTFAPDLPGGPKLLAVIQRTGQGGLTAILREAPPAPVRPPMPTAPVASPVDQALVADLRQRLAIAEAGRDKAQSEAAGRARFLANMSHELRTPLNAIMGFSDIMRTRLFGELAPKYGEYAELIHESGRHLLDLINDVLDMSKIEAHRYELSRETFDGREAVNAALRLMRLQADDVGVKVRGVLPAEPVEINADRRALKQIVLNLVSNAVKFTPRGGVVTVSAQRAAGAFEITVADTGVGIAPEDVERLGRPYEQAGGPNDRALGTGLGLSLVRSFAELHGGRMNVESRLGEGTAVAVRLPVLVEHAAPEPAAKVEPKPEPVGEAVAIAAAGDEAPMVLPLGCTNGKGKAHYPKVAPGGAPEA